MNWIYYIVERLGVETKSILRKKLGNQISLYETLKQEKNNLQKERIDLQKERVDLQQKLEEASREIKETEDLFNDAEKDKKFIKERLKYLEGIVNEKGKDVGTFSLLSKPEQKFLLGYIPQKISSKLVGEKYRLSNKERHYPRGFEGFLEKVADCKYIDWIDINFTRRDSRRKTSFNKIYLENGTIIIEGAYVIGSFGVFVKISTTAKDEKEAEYIRNLLSNKFK